MIRLLQSLSVLALLAIAGTADARHDNRVALAVRDLDTGRTLDAHWHAGERYVAGERGNRYALVLNNLTPRRLLVVLSVDGVNVVSGETAAPEQAGYVLAPYQQTEIRGWRKSLSEVAAFRFAALPQSYAARTGRPDNVGVIGVAVFEEALPPRPQPLPAPPIAARESAPSVPGAPSSRAGAAAPADSVAKSYAQPAPSLGTAHGERRHDPVSTTQFSRASRQPAEVQQLFYDSRENLVAAGVLPPPYRNAPRRPDPFPVGFVPDPR